jgi:hypothetical protein
MPESHPPGRQAPRWLVFLVFFGVYLSFHGYHSRDNDQAFRLPLLLHRQDASLFADDPFVRAFDAFNPHRGYLALLDAASRVVGLSSALAGLYALTFALTCLGIDRLARATWPEAGPRVGVVAVGLLLAAKAGNVGTNHLFEPILLERLIALALGWLALAAVVGDPRIGRWTAPVALGVAGWIHPSLGVQLGVLVGGGWLFWGLWAKGTGVRFRDVGWGLVGTALGMVPSLAFAGSQGRELLKGLPPEELRLICAYVQSPQHMLPHLWRWSQWLAWGCYLVLALLSLGEGRSAWPAARRRLVLVLGVNLIGLGLAWVAVEGLGDLRSTVFQPFRMATVARGLALVLVAPRVLRLWDIGWEGKARATVLVAGLVGDWTLVVATGMELAIAAGEWFSYRRGANVVTRSDLSPGAAPHDVGQGLPCRRRPRQGKPCPTEKMSGIAGLAAFGLGLVFLARHDTEAGHIRLLLALAGLATGGLLFCRGSWNPRRVRWAVAAAWAVPLAALLAPGLPRGEWLARHCRFAAVPVDDVERLAVWCREHTPRSARFVGPPGPKTFRLWSLRAVAFNRASSPYHAAGLADWAARFRDHVGFQGSTADFARAYLADRQRLERRYDLMSDAERADLARRQGASYVVAAPPKGGRATTEGPMELLHVEGRLAVYRVRTPEEAQARIGKAASAGTG